MKCPKCGAHSEVDKTRMLPAGDGVRRRRRCVAVGCRHPFTTHEFETECVRAYVPKKLARHG